MNLLKNEKFLFFLGGVAAAIIGKKAVKSKCAHNLAVKGLAAGMKFQKDALEKFQDIKDEATDLCLEAETEAEA